MGGREMEPSETEGHKNRRIGIKIKERHDGKIRPLAWAIISAGVIIKGNVQIEDNNHILNEEPYDESRRYL